MFDASDLRMFWDFLFTVDGPQYVGGPEYVGFNSNENSDLSIPQNEIDDF